MQVQSLGRVVSRWASTAPIATFLVGTFGWAWLLWGYWVPAMPPDGLEIGLPFVLTAIGGGFAPSLAAVAVTWLIGGRGLVAVMLSSLKTWRHGLGWYAVALLLVPSTAVVSAALQGAVIGPLRWPEAPILMMALIWPLFAALGEEIGWRGFLQARLQTPLGTLGAALVVGVVWGFWHLPADYIGLKAYGDWFIAVFLLSGPVLLTAHAVIMAWLWNRTNGNLPLAILYHISITASAMLAPAAGEPGPSGVLAAAIGAGVVWIAALGLIVLRRKDFT